VEELRTDVRDPESLESRSFLHARERRGVVLEQVDAAAEPLLDFPSRSSSAAPASGR
jgi:hypothetical protein